MRLNFDIITNPNYLPSYAEVVALLNANGFSLFSEGIHSWYSVTDKSKIFEIWNSDYIDKLTQYLIKAKCQTVLEVGAGNGKLSHFLKQKLPSNIKVIATDSGKWKIPTAFAVENLSYTKALAKYRPDTVISSWMPYEEDWTSCFRKCANTKRYILIGEIDGGCCGADSTWGCGESMPEYEVDGFARRDMGFGDVQICRTDYAMDDHIGKHSSTVVFERKEMIRGKHIYAAILDDFADFDELSNPVI